MSSSFQARSSPFFHTATPCAAFAGERLIAAGPLAAVVTAVKAELARAADTQVLVFEDAQGRPVDIDWRGDAAQVLATLPPAPADDPATEGPRGPGRPKLGVVAREVTLLPRHWDWLASQSGGASVALRKLVDAARKAGEQGERIRHAQEAAYRVMQALAGNQAGFEEASRALFAGDAAAFDGHTAGWPQDARDYTRRLAAPAFATDATA
ncbi:DUF2239 family protein [Uliginosibacterium sp. H1]|uniref:DUF2239 family protein n=1 Tax=Uliginosibacterium sp. H1 TaxID=3114757 RepID=UPI002E171BFB|nr:DUF2239 family protein [Uliginosibacterium sp. H1]